LIPVNAWRASIPKLVALTTEAAMQPIEALAKWQSWDLGKEFPRWNENLRDGTPVLVRPLAPEDAVRERILLEALSPQSRRFRFLCSMGHPSPELIGRLTHPLAPREIAFAVVADVHEGWQGFLQI